MFLLSDFNWVRSAKFLANFSNQSIAGSKALTKAGNMRAHVRRRRDTRSLKF
jgi:hypothetical protein